MVGGDRNGAPFNPGVNVEAVFRCALCWPNVLSLMFAPSRGLGANRERRFCLWAVRHDL
jgi:hypothetical protein